jgi:hypothetical protein
MLSHSKPARDTHTKQHTSTAQSVHQIRVGLTAAAAAKKHNNTLEYPDHKPTSKYQKHPESTPRDPQIPTPKHHQRTSKYPNTATTHQTLNPKPKP